MKNKIVVRVTQEQYQNELKKPLLDLGYREARNFQPYDLTRDMGILILSEGEIKNTYSYYWGQYDDSYTIIEEFNPELILALAAMTEGEDLITGEYLICINPSCGYKEGQLIKVSRVNNGHEVEYIEHSFGQRYSRLHFRKVRKEELIQKFSKENTNKMKKQNFTIEGTVALKEAFVKDGNFTVTSEQTISGNNYLSNYDCKLQLQGAPEKEELHFILPQDWDKAMTHVKEHFKIEFKVGDIVVVLRSPSFPQYEGTISKIIPNSCNTPKGKFVNINIPHNFDNGFNIQEQDIRHATQEEIEEYNNPKLPKINGYYGKVEGNHIVYGCAKLPITWFGGQNRAIKSLELNSGVKITEEEINQIRKVLNK